MQYVFLNWLTSLNTVISREIVMSFFFFVAESY